MVIHGVIITYQDGLRSSTSVSVQSRRLWKDAPRKERSFDGQLRCAHFFGARILL